MQSGNKSTNKNLLSDIGALCACFMCSFPEYDSVNIICTSDRSLDFIAQFFFGICYYSSQLVLMSYNVLQSKLSIGADSRRIHACKKKSCAASGLVEHERWWL